jgi:hypothetical protein
VRELSGELLVRSSDHASAGDVVEWTIRGRLCTSQVTVVSRREVEMIMFEERLRLA